MLANSSCSITRRRIIKGITAAGVIGTGLGTSSAVQAKNEQQVPDGRQQSVRAMTFNIHSGRGPGGSGPSGDYNLRRIANIIRDTDPDIVSLQEVDQNRNERSDFDNQPELLSEWLDMDVIFNPVIDRDPTEDSHPDRRKSGGAILSKHPILDSKIWDLPNIGSIDWKLLETKINVKGAQFWFYEVHLQSGRSREDLLAVRDAQVNRVMEIAGQREQVVLAGDFNLVDGRYGFADRFPVDTENYEKLTDIYVDAALEDGADDYTLSACRPNWASSRRDFILVTENIGVESADVIHMSDYECASDHRAVVADLAFVRGENGNASGQGGN